MEISMQGEESSDPAPRARRSASRPSACPFVRLPPVFADRRSAPGTFTPTSAPIPARAEKGGTRRRAGAGERRGHQPADPSVLRALDCLYGDDRD
jgi:hypothetical protein